MTTLPVIDARESDVRPRKISRRATGADSVFEHASRAVGASVLVITGGVGGKVTIKLPRLDQGKHSLKIIWGGNGVAVGSSKTFSIKQK